LDIGQINYDHLNPCLSENQLTCIAVISKFSWYGF